MASKPGLSKPGLSDATVAKLLLVALSLCWGLSWTAMRIALDEVAPWTLRFMGYAIGALTLLPFLKAQGRSLAIPGGRNWLPILNMGIIRGADIVRVGIEDCYWMYPHKDEVIKKNSDPVKVTVEMAQLLGRRVVTDPKEARKLLGLELTSKL